MVNFNFKTKQATPEWLTSTLSRNGFLSNGKVSSLEQTKFTTGAFISNFVSLRVTYSPGSLGAKPQKIILKAIKPELVESEKHYIAFGWDRKFGISLHKHLKALGLEEYAV